ncbi:hypothetical protein OE88DRAFT_1654863 [Heliocybe sulcata]|uniref:Uncharacterized protein n=1 Tax=Heliocybe sulcata TaxID=5364 RepID=A0A5C3N9C2_9AGAM|nr:hypothetical protein OE88DRAFT_1654863 [Heliocybe sulcata]
MEHFRFRRPSGADYHRWYHSRGLTEGGQQICSFIVKIFFVLRIRKLAKHNAVLFLFVPPLLTLAAFALYLKPVYQAPLITIYDPASLLYRRVSILLTISAGCGLLTDLAVTFSMCILLHRYKAQGGAASRLIMNRLLIYTLATGFLAM